MPSFLFLSYRTLDLEFALRLAAELKNAGLHVWMDRFDIPPGSDGQKEIQTAVDHCAAMICVLTPEYAVRDTTRNYCMDELARAYNANTPVFQVLLREIAPAERPLQLERLQHVDFRDWHSPERVDQMLIEIANTDTSLAVRCLRSGITGTGRAEQVIVSFLIADLTDRWDDDRHWPAADALKEIGEPALPNLLKLLRDPNLLEESFPWIRVIAGKLESVFQSIGDPAVAGLEEVLREGHPASREIARKSLAAINTRRAKGALAKSR